MTKVKIVRMIAFSAFIVGAGLAFFYQKSFLSVGIAIAGLITLIITEGMVERKRH